MPLAGPDAGREIQPAARALLEQGQVEETLTGSAAAVSAIRAMRETGGRRPSARSRTTTQESPQGRCKTGADSADSLCRHEHTKDDPVSCDTFVSP